jgi:hypothetical protein
MKWAKALGLPLLAVAVSVASFWSGYLFSRWQVRIAREKLRHDLYDRRFAIYMAFHELLVAISEKDDVELELRKANAARAHSPFLLDAQVGVYLQGLHKEAFRINETNKLVRGPDLWPPVERAQKRSQLVSDKLHFANSVEELVQKFERFLKLTDFSK